MQAPVFDDVTDPACVCPACEAERRHVALARRTAAGPVRRARRTAATVVTAGCVAAGLASQFAAAEEDAGVDDARSPDRPGPGDLTAGPAGASPAAFTTAVDPFVQLVPGAAGHVQGVPGPLRHDGGTLGRAVAPAPAAITPAPLSRDQIIARAQTWLDPRIPYNQAKYHNGYRTDCSGYVSMAWNIGTNAWTGNLTDYAEPIAKSELERGDILLFHNTADPVSGSHVIIFDKWADSARTAYHGYEQTPPGTIHRSIPYGYFSNAASYKPYRYKYLGSGEGNHLLAFPGAGSFGPGQSNDHVTKLGEMLIGRGGARFYEEGPDPEWGDADRDATAAFQRAQGWTGSEADGIPGIHTWDLLVTRGGKDIAPSAVDPTPDTTPERTGPTPFPGTAFFGPGRVNEHVTQLGEALVTKGYGRHYEEGPGPVWSEADRRNTQDFQRAQGWRGTEADGLPGPHTWQLLMS